jgi:hypothetical protein
LINEISTEIVDFCCFYGHDWPSYQNLVVRYLIDYFETQRYTDFKRVPYLMRLLCTRVYHLCFVERKLDFRDLERTDVLLPLVRDLLDGRRPRFFIAQDVDTEVSRCVDEFSKIRGVLPVFYRRLRGRDWFRTLTQRDRLFPIPASDLESLERGEVIGDHLIRDPWLLLYHQSRKSASGQVQFNERIAAILSLWHQYVTIWLPRLTSQHR